MAFGEKSYEALARKYRPQTFDDVVGQEHVITALKNSFLQNRIHHAYLLTGTRGIGKTTIARIMAKCLECESGITSDPHKINDPDCCSICAAITNGNFPDVIEIDGASQTKVDDTRVLLENTQYPPISGRFKIYIIDEVHMLSASSFNALLKTLEEPPAYVKFILATTDPQKIPTTVLSRCLQFQLKALSVEQITRRIIQITTIEQIPCEAEAAAVIARAARGSMRDALSLCDQAIALGNGELTLASAENMLGQSTDTMICNILELLKVNSTVSLEQVLCSIKEKSPNYKNLFDSLIVTLHDLALYQMIGGNGELTVFSTPKSVLNTFAPVFSAEALQLYYQIALSGLEELKIASDGSIAFEMAVLRLVAFTPEKKKIG